jgi:DNA-binding transcriptional regulator LsrR (DeoR family)
MLAQKGIAEVFELGRAATLRFVGIGNVEPDASVISSGMLETAEYEALKRAGAVGEVLGHFFDAEGRVLETVVSGRAISMSLEDIAARRTVAVAGGRGKVAAIRAVLTSGLLQGLLTDEVTARELLR